MSVRRTVAILCDGPECHMRVQRPESGSAADAARAAGWAVMVPTGGSTWTLRDYCPACRPQPERTAP